MPVLKAHYDPDQKKVIEYFRDTLHFSQIEKVLELYDDLSEKLERANKNKQKDNKKDSKPNASQPTIPSHLQDKSRWNLQNQSAENPIVEDQATTYLREVTTTCEHCGKKTTAKLNIIVADDKKNIKVLPAELSISR